MPHRTYKNPPIVEAICEFTFTPAEDWNPTLPGELHTLIREYYEGEPRQANIQIVTTDPGNNSVTVQNDLRVQLPTKDGTRLVSVGRNALSINVLKPYEGWTLFRPRIEWALQKYYDVAGHKTVTRVGVRYINRIVVSYLGATSADYFEFDRPLQSALGAKLTNFIKRSEYVAEDQTKILITHATIAPSAPGTTEFLLDIDAIFDGRPLELIEDILGTAKTLHATEGCAFEAIITEKARDLFDAD
jgi:uncharacterized protein (TIGR04255 family)